MPLRSTDSVSVVGLSDLRRELKALEDKGLIDELKDANQAVAQIVVDDADGRFRALGGMGALVAKTLKAGRTQNRAQVSFGGAKAPFAGGVEFGAERNVLRLRKNTGGRATKVRDEENLGKVIRRVEAQTVGANGKGSVARQQGGTRVQVTGRVRGWNQFQPWRGNGANAGYALYPAIRANGERIVDTYGDAIEKITKKAFPD